mgnify:CR=1 FL=1
MTSFTQIVKDLDIKEQADHQAHPLELDGNSIKIKLFDGNIGDPEKHASSFGLLITAIDQKSIETYCFINKENGSIYIDRENEESSKKLASFIAKIDLPAESVETITRMLTGKRQISSETYEVEGAAAGSHSLESDTYTVEGAAQSLSKTQRLPRGDFQPEIGLEETYTLIKTQTLDFENTPRADVLSRIDEESSQSSVISEGAEADQEDIVRSSDVQKAIGDLMIHIHSGHSPTEKDLEYIACVAAQVAMQSTTSTIESEGFRTAPTLTDLNQRLSPEDFAKETSELYPEVTYFGAGNALAGDGIASLDPTKTQRQSVFDRVDQLLGQAEEPRSVPAPQSPDRTDFNKTLMRPPSPTPERKVSPLVPDLNQTQRLDGLGGTGFTHGY